MSGGVGVKVGGTATFVARDWFEFAETGVTGGGNISTRLPFTFTCDPDGCTAPSFGRVESSGSLNLQACALGKCIGKTWKW